MRFARARNLHHRVGLSRADTSSRVRRAGRTRSHIVVELGDALLDKVHAPFADGCLCQLSRAALELLDSPSALLKMMRARVLSADGNERLRANEASCARSSSATTRSALGRVPAATQPPVAYRTLHCARAAPRSGRSAGSPSSRPRLPGHEAWNAQDCFMARHSGCCRATLSRELPHRSQPRAAAMRQTAAVAPTPRPTSQAAVTGRLLLLGQKVARLKRLL